MANAIIATQRRAARLPARRRQGHARLQGSRGDHARRRQGIDRARGLQGRRREHGAAAQGGAGALRGHQEEPAGGTDITTVYDQSTSSSRRSARWSSAAWLGGLLAILVVYSLPARRARDLDHGDRDPGLGRRHVLADVRQSNSRSTSCRSAASRSRSACWWTTRSSCSRASCATASTARSRSRRLAKAPREVAMAVVASTSRRSWCSSRWCSSPASRGQLFQDQALTVTFALLVLAHRRTHAGADARRGPTSRGAAARRSAATRAGSRRSRDCRDRRRTPRSHCAGSRAVCASGPAARWSARRRPSTAGRRHLPARDHLGARPSRQDHRHRARVRPHDRC